MDDSLVNQVLVGLREFSESADDRVGESIGQAEGMSDREDVLADFQFVGITKLGVVMRSLGKHHLEQGAIGLPIASDQLSRNACSVASVRSFIRLPVHTVHLCCRGDLRLP